MKEISAGGIVYRKRLDKYEVLLIEDRFGRWTLPKGKKEQGETDQETALREIREETGLHGRIVKALTNTYYTYRHPSLGKVEKEVIYFLIEAIEGTEEAQLEEIKGVSWMPSRQAWRTQKKVGYDNNQDVFTQAYKLLDLPCD